MSGGIDSSVAAALLLKQGYEVAGITMRVDNSSRASDIVAEAGRVASELGIVHHVTDVVDFFQRNIIDYFINEYLNGCTPNPCVCCNRELKFGLLLDMACQLGYDFLATGHYAVIKEGYLCRGADLRKDQSYFLYPIYNRDLSRILFPLGDMTKNDVRALGEQFGLHNAKKDESQDICFISTGDYTEFLKQNCGKDFLPGPILDTGGRVIGKHQGIQNFTIGQRKGLGALGKPMYVKEILPEDNAIVAATDNELMSSCVFIKEAVKGPDPFDTDKSYSVQVRYRSRAVACHLESVGEQGLKICFDEQVRAVAPGNPQLFMIKNGL
jgi:tRNA-specific 2-thiouridylase